MILVPAAAAKSTSGAADLERLRLCVVICRGRAMQAGLIAPLQTIRGARDFRVPAGRPSGCSSRRCSGTSAKPTRFPARAGTTGVRNWPGVANRRPRTRPAACGRPTPWRPPRTCRGPPAGEPVRGSAWSVAADQITFTPFAGSARTRACLPAVSGRRAAIATASRSCRRGRSCPSSPRKSRGSRAGTSSCPWKRLRSGNSNTYCWKTFRVSSPASTRATARRQEAWRARASWSAAFQYLVGLQTEPPDIAKENEGVALSPPAAYPSSET